MPGMAIMRGCGRVFFIALWLFVFAGPVLAQQEFSPPTFGQGILLVASPTLTDPHFQQTVLLIIEHGRGGTVGVVLNRPTDVLLSDVLPDLPMLKDTTHRLFAGGPVGQTQMVLLFRLEGPYPDAQLIFDGIYVGTPGVLERVITQAKPTEAFRVFAGFAGWAPGQLEQEMLEGEWGLLPKSSVDIFKTDPGTFWPDSLARLQAPMTISR